MMGVRAVMQESLFYQFRLEDHVPADSLLRHIDRFVDLTGLRDLPGALLQRDRAALDRSGAADPHADRRLMLFAHLKRILRLGRLRLRGPCGARDEFLLAATAQNPRKPAKLIPVPDPTPAT